MIGPSVYLSKATEWARNNKVHFGINRCVCLVVWGEVNGLLKMKWLLELISVLLLL